MSLEKIINGIKKVKSSLKTAVGLGIVGAASLGFGAGTTAEAAKYEIKRLNGVSVSGQSRIYINNDGGIVSSHYDFYRILPESSLYKDGRIIPLKVGDNFYSVAVGINDIGEILVKKYNNLTYEFDKSVIFQPGKTIELDFVGEDINNKGHVVGENYFYYDIFVGEYKKKTLGFQASVINDGGWIAGKLDERPVLAMGGGGPVIELERIPGPGGDPNYYNYFVYDINNKQQVVGHFVTKWLRPLSQACMWDEKGKIKQLSGFDSIAFAINDKGQIVGKARYDGNDVRWRGNDAAILWEKEYTEKIELDNFLPKGSSAHLIYAWDINDEGQIVCSGDHDAYLATPIPLEGDLNKDDIVNLDDLAVLSEHWLEEH